MSNIAVKIPISNQISFSTVIGIIASLGCHGALFAFPNLPLFSVNKQELKTTPIPVVQLNAAEMAKLPDLSPKPTQVPEFPNTPLPSTPILQSAVQLPFTAIPTPATPLPTTSLFLPPDKADTTNIKPETSPTPEIPEIPKVEELPVAKTVPLPPTSPNIQPPLEDFNKIPAIPRNYDLQELKRKLEDQQELESEMKVDINSIPLRSTNDILREFSNPQGKKNEENNSISAQIPLPNPTNPVNEKDLPVLPDKQPINPPTNPVNEKDLPVLPDKQPINPPTNRVNSREFPLLPNKQPINPPSEQDLLAMDQQNARVELQQRAAALEKNTANTSDKEANTNYLNWLITINNVKPADLTLKGKYPKDACFQKLEGSATYGVLVNAKGEPTRLQMIKSSGYPLFNENARFEISFYQFNKNDPKPYLVNVDYNYDTKICPDEKGNQKPTNQSTPPLLNNIPPSVKPSEGKKTDLTDNNPISEEKKPDLTDNNSSENNSKKPDSVPLNKPISEEKKPDLTDNNSSENNSKKPDSVPLNNPSSEEKKPDLTDDNSSENDSKKPDSLTINNPSSESKKPDLTDNNSSENDSKKPDSLTINNPSSESKKPDLTDDNSSENDSKKPDSVPLNNPISESKKPE